MPYADPAVQSAYQVQWQRQRRTEWLKANGPCVRCGSSVRLEVDHVDPSTKVSHRIWSWSRERAAVELAKCQVLCHDCHVAKRDNVRIGQDAGKAVLTNEVVLEIRRLHATGMDYAAIGAQLGINRKTAWWVGERGWKHLNG